MPATGERNQKIVEIEKDQLDRYVKRVNDLPTIPSVLFKIWRLCESPNSTPSDLEKVISLDQALTSKIIRVANSPFYGRFSRVSNVKSAVVNIGFEAIKTIAIAASVTTVFKKRKKIGRYFSLKDFWKHSIGVGVAAKAFAEKIDGVNEENCFCAGILHDIGKFVENLLFPEEFAKVLSLSARSDVSISEAETEVFGVDHSFFGELFARHWNFSDELKNVIAGHHKSIGDMEELYVIETGVIKVANSVIREMQFGFPGDFHKAGLDDEVVKLFDIQEGFMESFTEELSARLKEAVELINLF